MSGLRAGEETLTSDLEERSVVSADFTICAAHNKELAKRRPRSLPQEVAGEDHGRCILVRLGAMGHVISLPTIASVANKSISLTTLADARMALCHPVVKDLSTNLVLRLPPKATHQCFRSRYPGEGMLLRSPEMHRAGAACIAEPCADSVIYFRCQTSRVQELGSGLTFHPVA